MRIAIAIACWAALLLSLHAGAAVFQVDSTADTSDAAPGDGVCADATGACTLRAAIDEANSLPGPDEVSAPAGTYLLTLSYDDDGNPGTPEVPLGLGVSDSLTIAGAGPSRTTIRGGPSLDVLLSASGLDLIGLTVAGGRLIGIECGVCSLRSVSVTGSGWYGIAVGGSSVRIEDSTIQGNGFEGAGLGGGIMVAGFSDLGFCEFHGYLHLINSTVSENAAGIVPPFLGCWQFNEIRIENSTIVGNETLGVWLFNGTNVLRNSIVADQVGGPDCGNSTGPGRGEVDSRGHNLDSDGSCALSNPTDLSNVDPLLGPLTDNGGPTPTHAVLRGSPAIDAIPVGDCTWDDDGDPGTPEVPLATDQRGVARPREGNGAADCDIGAYEATKCADGIDNDGDGRIDFDGGATAGLPPEERTAPDPHCASALSKRESQGCGLGVELVGVVLLLCRIAARRV